MKNKKVFKVFCYITFIFVISLSTFTAVSAATARDAADSVVIIGAVSGDGQNGGTGTGFALGEPGKKIEYIATNYHVIAPAYENNGTVTVCFSLAANKTVKAEVYWKNAQKDLAILKLPEPTDERKALVICPTDKINIDDTFTALGYPAASSFNDFTKLDKTDIVITKGGISKKSRINETDCYLIDIQISEGNSGGPVVNSKGEVVGISQSYIKSQAGENHAVFVNSYAIVINELLANIDRKVIPVTIAGEITTLTWLYIGCGAVGVIIVIVLLIVIMRRKKSTVDSIPIILDNIQPQQPQPSGLNAYIRGLSGNFVNQTFDIQDKLVIGRDNNKCTVAYPLDAPGISGTHCELISDESGVSLRDLGSSYGTFLSNGTKLNPNQPVKLGNGSIFYLASEENTFEIRM